MILYKDYCFSQKENHYRRIIDFARFERRTIFDWDIPSAVYDSYYNIMLSFDFTTIDVNNIFAYQGVSFLSVFFGN